ncbi:hypothetical protein BDV93DRAFT_119336 [Ceratobasidium sp. AG-I]|nr:hypothetical protein BDV93DRAFT_119336 [Ceratobasidium sp. AG-I]
MFPFGYKVLRKDRIYPSTWSALRLIDSNVLLEYNMASLFYDFGAYDTLPPNLMSSSRQFLKFTSKYISSSPPSFGWTAFKSAVSSYPGSDLAAGKSTSTTITQDGLKAQTMLDNVLNVSGLFGPGIDANEVKSLIEYTLNSPGQKPENQTFKITFAPAAADRLYGLVMTIKIQVDKPSQKMSAVFDAMALDVKQGFRAPRQ